MESNSPLPAIAGDSLADDHDVFATLASSNPHYIGNNSSIPSNRDNPDSELLYRQESGYLAPTSLYFGDGRHFRLKYYQYSSNAAQIGDANEQSDLDKLGVDVEFDTSLDPDDYKPIFSFQRLWQYTGPGWLMSIAYLDPGNLESDLQAGAIAGYDLIWVLFWATALGWCLQTLAARLGCVTGRHLAQICRYEYNKPTAILLWIFTELAIIGSDIQEVIGSAIAFKLLFGWPLFVGCLVTALDAFTFLLLGYLGMRALEAFFCSLITIMAVCFAIEFAIGQPDIGEILEHWAIPMCENNAVEQAVGMVGAVIMPHNLFLHSALVQTRNLHRNHKGAVKEGNYYFAIEGGVSLFVSFLINLCIVAVFARGFYNNKNYNANDIGLSTAGERLEQEFSTAAKYVWAIGLLAAGQASTMTGTFAGQYAMQGFLNLHWSPWKRTLLTRTIALGPSLFIAITAKNYMDTLDEWLNVQQSVQLPFALLPLLFFNSNPRIMGEFTLSKRNQIFYWICSAGVIVINVYLTVQFAARPKNTWYEWVFFVLFLALYLGIIAYLIYDFFSQQVHKFRKHTQAIVEDEELSQQYKTFDPDNPDYSKQDSQFAREHDTNKKYYFAKTDTKLINIANNIDDDDDIYNNNNNTINNNSTDTDGVTYDLINTDNNTDNDIGIGNGNGNGNAGNVNYVYDNNNDDDGNISNSEANDDYNAGAI